MTPHFTASNGIEIEISEHGYLLGKGDYGSGPTYATAGPEGIDALREYFQHERDAGLGRWRDFVNFNMVVYPHSANVVRVVDETTGVGWDVTRPLHLDDLDAPSWHGAATRYFAAHPARQPWHDANPGEAWLLDLGNGPGRESPATVGEFPKFRTAAGNYISLNDPSILHATRIWPEESDDE